MKNISIVYATMTKHSRKLATAIGQALAVKAENVKDSPVLQDVDLLFIVGGIYGGESLQELKSFASGLDGRAVKSVALVTSCVSKKHGQTGIRALLEEKGVTVVDEFLCQGNFLWMGFGHPDQADLEEAVRFARRLAGKEKDPA